MYTNYSNAMGPMVMNHYPQFSSQNQSEDRVGGFLFPFVLGGITGGLLSPAFYPRPYYRPYPYYTYPYYGPYYR